MVPDFKIIPVFTDASLRQCLVFGGWVAYPGGHYTWSGLLALGPVAGRDSNVAELLVIAATLRTLYAQRGGRRPILIQSDSKVGIDYLTEQCELRTPRAPAAKAEVEAAAAVFPAVLYGWVPREQNKAAHRQANESYRLVFGPKRRLAFRYSK